MYMWSSLFPNLRKHISISYITQYDMSFIIGLA